MELYLEQWDFWHDRNPNGNTNKVCYCKETQLNVEDLLRHACLCYYTVFVLSSNHKGFVFLLFYIQRLHAYVRRTCLPCYLFTVCVCVFSVGIIRRSSLCWRRCLWFWSSSWFSVTARWCLRSLWLSACLEFTAIALPSETSCSHGNTAAVPSPSKFDDI